MTTARQRNPGANTGAVRALLRTLEAEMETYSLPSTKARPPPSALRRPRPGTR